MASNRISVRVAPELRERLSREAMRRSKRESEVLREALQSYFGAGAGSETCYELAKRAGLIGVMKRGPFDLSANRKHFKGFGE
jgi:hypothetical protein